MTCDAKNTMDIPELRVSSFKNNLIFLTFNTNILGFMQNKKLLHKYANYEKY